MVPVHTPPVCSFPRRGSGSGPPWLFVAEAEGEDQEVMCVALPYIVILTRSGVGLKISTKPLNPGYTTKPTSNMCVFPHDDCMCV